MVCGKAPLNKTWKRRVAKTLHWLNVADKSTCWQGTTAIFFAASKARSLNVTEASQGDFGNSTSLQWNYSSFHFEHWNTLQTLKGKPWQYERQKNEHFIDAWFCALHWWMCSNLFFLWHQCLLRSVAHVAPSLLASLPLARLARLARLPQLVVLVAPLPPVLLQSWGPVQHLEPCWPSVGPSPPCSMQVPGTQSKQRCWKHWIKPGFKQVWRKIQAFFNESMVHKLLIRVSCDGRMPGPAPAKM